MKGVARTDSLPPIETIREAFSYDAETGILRWAERRNHRTRRGAAVGSRTPKGHLRVVIDGQPILVHRVIWAHVYGTWPENQIDHINGNPSDNRLSNLRPATNRQNQCNAKTRVDNTTGRVGVYWAANVGKWRPMIRLNGKNVCLGLYETFPEAVAVREQAEREHYGEYARPRGTP